MSVVDYAKGLTRAHEIINAAHDRVEQEHLSIAPDFWGMPTKRQNELMAVSRELRKIGNELLIEVKALKPGDAPIEHTA